MSRTAVLRALERRLHIDQVRLVRSAELAEAAGFRRTVGPGLRESARQVGVFRLVVDAVADVQRDPRGARGR